MDISNGKKKGKKKRSNDESYKNCPDELLEEENIEESAEELVTEVVVSKSKKKKKSKHKDQDIHSKGGHAVDKDLKIKAEQTTGKDSAPKKRKSEEAKSGRNDMFSDLNEVQIADNSKKRKLSGVVKDTELIAKKKKKKKKSRTDTEEVCCEHSSSDLGSFAISNGISNDTVKKHNSKNKRKKKDLQSKIPNETAGFSASDDVSGELQDSYSEVTSLIKSHNVGLHSDRKRHRKKHKQKKEASEEILEKQFEDKMNALEGSDLEQQKTKREKKKKKKKERSSISVDDNTDKSEAKQIQNASNKNDSDSVQTNYCASMNGRPEENRGPEIGQWSSSSLGDSDRQNKFFRLLGGFKKGSDMSGIQKKFSFGRNKETGDFKIPLGSDSKSGGNLAMDKSQEEMYTKAMERDYEKAMTMNMNRGVGLGFEKPPDAGKKFYIDTKSSKSIKFDD